MSTAQIHHFHLSLTCRTVDVDRFLEIGLGYVRSRGDVTDLVESSEPERDWSRERSRIAKVGIPFYGYATIGNPFGRTAGPVVFAAHRAYHCEAPAGPDKYPAAQITTNGFFFGHELLLGRSYYRRLAKTLAALPDPEPWLPSLLEPDHLSCISCGGRGWEMALHEKTGIQYVARCESCCRFPNDRLAGLVAFGSIESGWPE